MSYSLRCLALILLFTALVYSPTDAAAQTSSARLRITPSTASIGVGERAQLVVEVVDVQSLYAFDVKLAFDPSVLEIVDADPSLPGTQVSFGTFLDSGLVARNQVDADEGTIHFAMTQLRPTEPKAGGGVLLVIQAQGKSASVSSPLSIVSGQLASRDGLEIPSTLFSGAVTVRQTASTQPTSTPVPTQAPGIMLPTATAGPAAQPVAPTEVISIPAAPEVPATATLVAIPTVTPALELSDDRESEPAGAASPDAPQTDADEVPAVEQTVPSSPPDGVSSIEEPALTGNAADGAGISGSSAAALPPPVAAGVDRGEATTEVSSGTAAVEAMSPDYAAGASSERTVIAPAAVAPTADAVLGAEADNLAPLALSTYPSNTLIALAMAAVMSLVLALSYWVWRSSNP